MKVFGATLPSTVGEIVTATLTHGPFTTLVETDDAFTVRMDNGDIAVEWRIFFEKNLREWFVAQHVAVQSRHYWSSRPDFGGLFR